MKNSENSSPKSGENAKKKAVGVSIPKLPSRRQNDYYVIHIQFSKKLAGLVIFMIIALTRVLESFIVELLIQR